MKIPLDDRIANMDAWFHRKNTRPLLGFYLDSQYPLHRYGGSGKHLPDGRVRPEDVVVEDYLDDCDRLYGLYEEAGGDLIWSAAPFFGLPWVEASLGCGVIADHKTGSTRSEPPAYFKQSAFVPRFDERNPWVEKLDEFFLRLKRHSEGRYPVGVTLMRGISDLLSALYGGEELLYRMTDSPDEVKAVAADLADYWVAFGRHMLERLELFHGGTGAFFYSAWCPGRTIWMQEDAAALLSPDLYGKFILGPDRKILQSFENTVVHFHPARFIPVDSFLEGGVGAVEIHIDRGGPRAADLASQYRKVLESKPLLIWGDLNANDLEFIMGSFPHKGLAVNIVVSSPEEAEAVWDRTMRRYYE